MRGFLSFVLLLSLRTLVVSATFLICGTETYAEQNSAVDFALGIGSSRDDVLVRDLLVDGHGGMFLAGDFSGSINLGEEGESVTIHSQGEYDAFILRIGADGVLDWVETFGGEGIDRIEGMALDNEGGVAVSGYFIGPFEFAVDTEWEVSSEGGHRPFVLRLEDSGDLRWAVVFDAYSDMDISNMVVGDKGGLLCTGSFKGEIDFDPGPGYEISVSEFFAPQPSNGSDDSFLLKLDEVGQFEWVQTIGSYWTDAGKDVELDEDGNIYVLAEVRGTIDMDPGEGVHFLGSGVAEPVNTIPRSRSVLQKLDSEGNFVWAEFLGGETANGMALDSSGYLYVSGTFRGEQDFGSSDLKVHLT